MKSLGEPRGVAAARKEVHLQALDFGTVRRKYPHLVYTVGESWLASQVELLNSAVAQWKLETIADLIEETHFRSEYKDLNGLLLGLIAKRELPGRGTASSIWILFLEWLLGRYDTLGYRSQLPRFRAPLRNQDEFFQAAAELYIGERMAAKGTGLTLHNSTEGVTRNTNYDIRVSLAKPRGLLRADVKWRTEATYSGAIIPIKTHLSAFLNPPGTCDLFLARPILPVDAEYLALAVQVQDGLDIAAELGKQGNSNIIRSEMTASRCAEGIKITFLRSGVLGQMILRDDGRSKNFTVIGTSLDLGTDERRDANGFSDLLAHAALQLAGPMADKSINICFLGAHNAHALEEAISAAIGCVPEDSGTAFTPGCFTDSSRAGGFAHVQGAMFFSLSTSGATDLMPSIGIRGQARFLPNPSAASALPKEAIEFLEDATSLDWDSGT